MTGAHIIGYGVTSHEACVSQSFEDAIFSAANRALDDADINRGDIESVVLAGYDLEVGRTVSNMDANAATGGFMREEIRLGNNGAIALAHAIQKLRAGNADFLMLTAYAFPEATEPEYVENLAYDPMYTRPLGLSDVSMTALQADRYAKTHDGVDDAASQVIEKNRENGSKNELAQYRDPVSATDGREDDLVCSPLRIHDVPPESHGIISMVLAPNEVAGYFGSPVHVKSVGWHNDRYAPGEKDLTSLPSLSAAVQTAYDAADIDDPRSDLDLIEIAEASSYHELLAYEALDLCSPGEAPTILQEGVTGPAGEIPVNLSGGSLCWNPKAATGLTGLVEIIDRIREGDATTGLAHGADSNGMQANGVAIVEESHV